MEMKGSKHIVLDMESLQWLDSWKHNGGAKSYSEAMRIIKREMERNQSEKPKQKWI